MSWYHTAVYHLTIKPRKRKLEKLLPGSLVFPTGSRYICDPPIIGTDLDLLIYSETDYSNKLRECEFIEPLNKDYFSIGDDWGKFQTYRKGVLNLIVTNSIDFAERHITATHICRRYNTTDKAHRVFVHDLLRHLDILTQEDWSTIPSDLNPNLESLVKGFFGIHAKAMYRAYKIRHNIRVV